MIPKVKKNVIPNRPRPLTPPLYAIPEENKATDRIRTMLRSIKIFFNCLDMELISSSMIHYSLTVTGSAPGTTTSSAILFSFFKAIVVAVPMKLKKRMAAGTS